MAALERLAGPPALRARAHRVRALHSLAFGERERAETEARAGLALGLPDLMLQSQLWSALGGALWAQGRVEEALVPLSRSDELNEGGGDPKELAIGRANLGLAHSGLGRYREAAGHYGRALEVEELLGDPVGVAETLNNLAAAQTQLGLTSEAIATLDRALAQLNSVQGAAAVEVQTVTALSDRHRELGDYTRSLGFASRAVEIANALRPHFWGLAHGVRATTLSVLGRPDEADEVFEHALSRPGLRPTGEASLREALAEHRRLYGPSPEPAGALAEADAALASASAREQVGLELAALVRRAGALLVLGEFEEAAGSARRAVALLEHSGPPR